MFTFTKEEAVFAAKQFCYALEIWTSGFAGASVDQDDFTKDDKRCYVMDDKIDKRLSVSTFVHNIDLIYDFARTGAWCGEYIFENRDTLENELCEPLTELSAFTEVFYHDNVNLHKLNGNDIMDAEVSGKNIIVILKEVISLAFARYMLIIDGILDLDALALLADVSLKTVRNAVSSKTDNRLVLSAGSIEGKPCVDAMEAMRWLETKKGYAGPFFVNEIPEYKTYQSLGQLQYHCLSLMKKSKIEWDVLQEKASWDDSTVKAYQALLSSKISDDLVFITPETLNTFSQLCNASDIETLVKEGSKIAAATLAEHKSIKLFS